MNVILVPWREDVEAGVESGEIDSVTSTYPTFMEVVSKTGVEVGAVVLARMAAQQIPMCMK